MKRIWNIKKKSGVSPVIATILMVAITVVLAAVLYVMVMNMSQNQNSQSPSGSFALTQTSGRYVNLTFGQFNPDTGVSQFKFILSDQTAGLSASWSTTSDANGATFTNTSTMTAVNSISYYDPVNNNKINQGDVLVIQMSLAALNHQYKVQMVHVPSGNTVTYTEFTY
jgi:flagellin-like protein